MMHVDRSVKRLSRQEQQEQTRLALLEAAIRLFIERSIEATTIEQVAAAAGFTRGAFYSNFASKDELFVEATRHFFENVLFERSAPLAGGDVDAASRETYARISSVADSKPSIFIAEACLYAFRHPDTCAEFAALHEAQLARATAWIEGAMETYGVKDAGVPPRVLADITQAAIFGLHLKELVDPEVHAGEAFGAFIALLLRGAQAAP